MPPLPASPTTPVAEHIPLMQRLHKSPHGPASPSFGDGRPSSPFVFPPKPSHPGISIDGHPVRRVDMDAPSPTMTGAGDDDATSSSDIPLPSTSHAEVLSDLRVRIDSLRVATDSSDHPRTSSPTSYAASPLASTPARPAVSAASEAFFEHLSTIRHLQQEVAKVHVKLEKVGEVWSDQEKRTAAKGPEEGGSRTEEAFDEAADMFAQRQEVVEEIMTKLSTLSSSLTQFHTLAPPFLQFPRPFNVMSPSPGSSRSNTLHKPPTPASSAMATSSRHPTPHPPSRLQSAPPMPIGHQPSLVRPKKLESPLRLSVTGDTPHRAASVPSPRRVSLKTSSIVTGGASGNGLGLGLDQ